MHEGSVRCVLMQVLDYIKVDDFQGAETLQGNETRARVVEALKIISHTLQANRSQEGTIVTVKDLINLPREVSSHLSLWISLCSPFLIWKLAYSWRQHI